MRKSLKPSESLVTAGIGLQDNERFPTGIVSFLFTDIEGSSNLAEEYPVEIGRLLERHNTILRQSFTDHGGYIFLIAGDAFCCAFLTAGDAVEAALEAQRRLQEEPWHPAIIRVRMGIHTGEAEFVTRPEHGSAYEGYLTLARVQRVMSSAHGGQVLLSGPVVERVAGQLDPQVSFRDLGEVRLKGFSQAERLWQLVVPDLAADFPPINSSFTKPFNLPAAPTAMIGRQAELTEILQCLSSSQVRLVTLTGPGGIGKTRMAIQAASDLVEQFPQGVFWIDLAVIRDPEQVPVAMTRALGLRETSDLSPLDDLKRQLRDKKCLLVLDNFEQVTAASSIIAELLQDCHQIRVMTTSREALRLRGEKLIPIQPLGLPPLALKASRILQSAADYLEYEAVRLFCERVQVIKPEFALSKENVRAIVEICRRLDGLPLAIELAAARSRLFSPQALLERLGKRLDLLRGGARDLPSRQQTLRGAINWSYELLEPGEQRLFELLSVFSGGSTIPAIESIAAMVAETTGQPSSSQAPFSDVIEHLASLVEKSLVRQVELDTGESRFYLLETIREYAVERISENGNHQVFARKAHASFYADFIDRQWQKINPQSRTSAVVEPELQAIQGDLENVQSAWEYWVGEREVEQLNKILDGLWLFYDRRAWYHSTIRLAIDMLVVLNTCPPTKERIQQEILMQTSLARSLLVMKGYTAEVEKAYTRALELSQGAGDIPELFPALRGLASLYGYLGNYAQARLISERILAMAERLDDSYMLVEGHSRLGYILALTGDLRLGLDHLDLAIAMYDPQTLNQQRYLVGNNPGVINLNISALLLWMSGYATRALERAAQAQVLANRLAHPYSQAYALFHSGLLFLWMDDLDQAQVRSQAVLELARENEYQVWEAVATCLGGSVLARKSQPEAGLIQIRQGISMYQGLKTPPVFWPMLIFMEAEAYGLVGRPEEGIAALSRVFEMVGQFDQSLLTVEFMRLNGDLILANQPARAAEVEPIYLQALGYSHKEGALMLELRVALRLYHLWEGSEKQPEGKKMLQELIGRFTESLDTVDVREALSLISSNG